MHLRFFLKANSLLTLGLTILASSFAVTEAVTKTKNPTQSVQEFSWTNGAKRTARRKLRANLSPTGTRRGVVVASPSRHSPNYFFHWIRDAALVMREPLHWGLRLRRPQQQQTAVFETALEMMFEMMDDFVDLTLENQATGTLTGLGEPKFNVDGSAFNGPWGRPQNDGPALRAVTLSAFALEMIRRGNENYVREKLFRGQIPAVGAIKRDLEFVSHHWRAPSFDLWEETLGDQFYTRMTQLKSMRVGSILANRLGDFNASDWYEQQARAILQSLNDFVTSDGWIKVTHDQRGGLNYKASGIDIAIVLAVLHSPHRPNLWGPLDLRILKTAQKIEQSFQATYALNRATSSSELAPAIGRYPEDRYYGGNPWFLTTYAMAEYYYRVAGLILERRPSRSELSAIAPFVTTSWGAHQGQSPRQPQRSNSPNELATKFVAKADAYLRRAKRHLPADFSMSEQFHRQSGYSLAAPDLTWSYAAFLSMERARQNAKRRLGGRR